jgi:hypothetical protein
MRDISDMAVIVLCTMGTISSRYMVHRRFSPNTRYRDFMDTILTDYKLRARWPTVYEALGEQWTHIPEDFALYAVQDPLSDTTERMITMLAGSDEPSLDAALPLVHWAGAYQEIHISAILLEASDYILVLTPSQKLLEAWSANAQYSKYTAERASYACFPGNSGIEDYPSCLKFCYEMLLRDTYDYESYRNSGIPGCMLDIPMSEGEVRLDIDAIDLEESEAAAIQTLGVFVCRETRDRVNRASMPPFPSHGPDMHKRLTEPFGPAHPGLWE